MNESWNKISAQSHIFVAPKERATIVKFILIIILLVFTGRLFQLQVLSSEKFKVYSQAQAIKKIRIIPPRGQIFDLNNKLLVHNQASFNLNIIPASFDSSSLKLLQKLLEIDTSLLNQALKLKNKFEKYTPFTIQRDIDFETISIVKEYQQYLKGVSIEVVNKRLYSDSVRMPHILGYIRVASDAQLKQYPYLVKGDKVGQDGVEKYYDEILRGVEGYEIVAFNREGKRVDKISEEFEKQEPIAGANLYLTINFEWQLYAEKLLGNRRGAIVGIDPRNGEVRFLVSKPDYDPDIFSGKLTQEQANYLFNDPSNPMMNRVTQGLYPPGSTWKMLIAIAGLSEGIITPTSTIGCAGVYHYGTRSIKCHGAHGNINVLTALQVSCNPFFAILATRLGINTFAKYGYLMGFGQPTGIDLPSEKSGVLPDTTYLKAKFKRENVSFLGFLPNYGIGQGEILVTPLQMAVYTAAIANKGTLFQPSIVREIENVVMKKREKIPHRATKLPIDPRVFETIHRGMYKVVNEGGGTATNASIPGLKVCGKTGTAQNNQRGGRDHSWFVCFAPMDNPEIAIAVIVENAGFGAQVAAPIARNMLMKVFNIQPVIKKDSTIVEVPNGLD